jgi:nitric oxide reductase subunit B
MQWMVWLRVPGDVVFALGIVSLAAFAWKLLGRSKAPAPATVIAAQASHAEA